MEPGAWLGTRRETDGISLAEVRYPPGFSMGLHAHPEPYFTVTLAGTYTEWTEGAVRTCEAGAVVFRPAGEAHATLFHDRPARCLRLRLSPAWLAAGPRDLTLPERSVGLRGGPLGSLAVQLHGELVAGSSRVGIEGLTHALVAGIARREVAVAGGAPAWLPRVLDRIHAEFQQPMRLADLAATAGIHPLHLARAFRRRQGVPVAAYIRRLRLESGLRELRFPNRTIAEIALFAGFADQSHFTRAFKKMTGLTPKAYRRTLGSF